MTTSRHTNRLVREKSPYLLQHAHDPVDWYPWGEEAFAAARREEKPILLSIGYSTCHWCHVMERESFEDEAIAAMMNQLYVCIKVDREERPDVDRVYMAAVQAMTGSGGWPLTVFLTPALEPFYGGTYFPPRDTNGRSGFPTLLRRVREVFDRDREHVVESGQELVKYLRNQTQLDEKAGGPDDALVGKTFHQIAGSYDAQHAGLGSGAKFPRPVVLNFLHRYQRHSGDRSALTMALATLDAMARGGIHDHLGGGFHRYTVDTAWRVPHFEKMLYDQAQLVSAYLDAFAITGEERFAETARSTVEYVLRDLTTPEGGFASGEDADSSVGGGGSESREGAFYLWTRKEFDELLGDHAEAASHFFGVDQAGNAPNDPYGEFAGRNILYTPFTEAQAAEHLGLDAVLFRRLIAEAKRKLLAARAARPRPHRDDKVVAGWNGLMISAAARASVVFGEQRYLTGAVHAAELVVTALYDPRAKSLRRRYRDGEARFDAMLEDYAFVIRAFLDLYEATADSRWLQHALDLHGTQVAYFWDSSDGGFFDSPGRDPSVLVRSKEAYDGAEPSGNSVSVSNMLRLAHLTGEERFVSMAERTLGVFSATVRQSPQVMPEMMCGIIAHRSVPPEIVLAGDPSSPDLRALLQVVRKHYLPDALLLYPGSAEKVAALAKRMPVLRSMQTVGGRAAAYVCRDFVCQLPVTEPDLLGALLRGEAPAR